MADYPLVITTKPSVSLGNTLSLATSHDKNWDEIVAIQTELGTSPSGTFADVKTRLDAGVVDSHLQLDTHAGYGSTNTKIPYFTNVRSDIDTSSAWTYTNDSTSGFTLTIDKPGIFYFAFSSFQNGVDAILMLSKNASLTTAPASLTTDKVLQHTQDNAGRGGCITWMGPLVENDVIAPHTDAVTVGFSRSWFTAMAVRLT